MRPAGWPPALRIEREAPGVRGAMLSCAVREVTQREIGSTVAPGDLRESGGMLGDLAGLAALPGDPATLPGVFAPGDDALAAGDATFPKAPWRVNEEAVVDVGLVDEVPVTADAGAGVAASEGDADVASSRRLADTRLDDCCRRRSEESEARLEATAAVA